MKGIFQQNIDLNFSNKAQNIFIKKVNHNKQKISLISSIDPYFKKLMSQILLDFIQLGQRTFKLLIIYMPPISPLDIV